MVAANPLPDFMTLLVGAVIARYFPFLSFLIGVEVARTVKEEGPASVDYVCVNGSIMSGLPVVVGEKERAPVAVYRLG